MLDYLLEFFRGPPDPSRDWQRSAGLQLQFDLNAGRLNSAGLGDHFEALSFLGPSNNRRLAALGWFEFHDLGITIECDDWDIVEIVLVLRDENAEVRPYAGKFLFRGREVELAGATEQSFVEHFGDCYWRAQDDDEIILFYEFPELEWQVEFDLRGCIKAMDVTNRILMADEEQRELYGVTKAWPPQFS